MSAHDWQRMPLRPGEVVRWTDDDICEAWDGSRVAYLDEQESCGWSLAASGPEADAAVEKHVWGAA